MPELPSRVDELTDEVAKLRQAVEHFAPQVAAARRISGRTATSLAVLLVIVVGLGLLGLQLWQTSGRLESLIEDTVCPVMALTVGSYDPGSRPLNPDGSFEGSPRARYQHNADVMADAFQRLGCEVGPVPPRQPA